MDVSIYSIVECDLEEDTAGVLRPLSREKESAHPTNVLERTKQSLPYRCYRLLFGILRLVDQKYSCCPLSKVVHVRIKKIQNYGFVYPSYLERTKKYDCSASLDFLLLFFLFFIFFLGEGVCLSSDDTCTHL